jgi:hypothetical protein
MSYQPAMPPNNLNQPFSEGTPVYDVNGEQVGTVSRHDPLENTLVLQKGTLFQRDIQVPLSAVQRSDARGIYLSVSRDELQQDRYAVPSAAAEPGEGGLIAQGVDVIEQTPHTITHGVDVIEQAPRTYTKGVDTIEQPPHTITKGADTIEPDTETEGPATGRA